MIHVITEGEYSDTVIIAVLDGPLDVARVQSMWETFRERADVLTARKEAWDRYYATPIGKRDSAANERRQRAEPERQFVECLVREHDFRHLEFQVAALTR